MISWRLLLVLRQWQKSNQLSEGIEAGSGCYVQQSFVNVAFGAVAMCILRFSPFVCSSNYWNLPTAVSSASDRAT